MKLSFLTPNSALRINLKLLIPHCAFLIIFNSCFLTAKYNHPMDGIGGIILNAFMLNSAKTTTTTVVQSVTFTGMPSVITEGQTASVDVKLALATTSAIQVTLTLDNPAITVDGLASKVLTFTPENATVNQTIKLAAVTDTNKISELVNIKVTATGLADQTVSISAVDNTPDAPVITANPPTSLKEGTSTTFGVRLTGTVSSNYTISILSSNSNSISVNPTTLTITPSNHTTDQTITILALQDLNGISEIATLTLSSTGLTTVTSNITALDDECYSWGCFGDNANGTISFTGAGTLTGTNLIWMKCWQGENYDLLANKCDKTFVTFQYCTTNDNACDNGNAGNNYIGILTSGPAYNTCNSLNSNPTGGFAGKTNWRVPTLDELKSLVYCSNGPNTPMIDNAGCTIGYTTPTIHSYFSSFPGPYWSSTSISNGDAAITIDFNYGNIQEPFRTDHNFVRCVSTGP